MKRIDAHLHFCLTDEYFDATAQNAGHQNTEHHLRQIFLEHDIAHGIVMGNRSLEMDNHIYPDFLSYCIGLDYGYFDEESLAHTIDLVEQHLRRDQCVGIKLYPGYCNLYLNDPLFTPFYELAARYDKTVAIHTGATATADARLKYSHPLQLDEVAVDFPRTRFVLCHFGNPWLADAAAVLEKNENVFADLSGLLEGQGDFRTYIKENATYFSYLQMWLGYVGNYEKFLFGTDWPIVNIPFYIDFVTALIPERHLEQVFFDNARAVYGLSI